ncbi:MAG: 4-hydroxy-tetrahydrodipicolinate reductase, partial [Planctomycetota bacterium]
MTDSATRFRLAVSGALGRMGRRVLALADGAGADVVAAVDQPDKADQKLSDHQVAPAGTPIGDCTLVTGLTAGTDGRTAQVCIDFSTPAAAAKRAAECAAAGIALVSGTTGGDDTLARALDAAATKVPVLLASNFSLGVALAAELTRRAVEVLGPDFECEIVEFHHSQKVDAPSGTALTLARAAAAGAKVKLDDVISNGRSGHTGSRPRQVIGVHAVRGGDVVGEHTVYLLGPQERVEITHKAGARDIFVRGALRTARWLIGQA